VNFSSVDLSSKIKIHFPFEIDKSLAFVAVLPGAYEKEITLG